MGNKKGLSLFFASLMLFFYFFIVMFAFFEVLQIDLFENFFTAIIFEIIGFAILSCLIFVKILGKQIKLGYFLPLVIVTVVYTILINLMNFVGITFVPNVLFTLIHLVVLFVYCLLSIPMFIMGLR